MKIFFDQINLVTRAFMLNLKPIIFLCGLIHSLFLLGAATPPPAALVLSAGDELTLSVFDDTAVTRKAIVSAPTLQSMNTVQPALHDAQIYRFFDDAVYTVSVARVSEVFNGAQLIEGRCAEIPEITFQAVKTDTGVRYELEDTLRGFMYQAVSRHDGSLLIAEYDRSRGEPIFQDDIVAAPDDGADPAASALSTADPGEVYPLATTEIDVMLVFDQSAQSYAAANGGITAFANAVVGKMNTAHLSSGTESTFRLVHIHLSTHTYNTSTEDLGTLLEDLRYQSGGVSEVSALRDTRGADLVSMLVDTGSAYGSTGIAYIPGSSSGSSMAAFSVCSIRSVNISHTMTHEIGHNLGCGHTKTQVTQPGPGIFSYAAGWYFTGSNNTKYHTIMGYDSDGRGNYYYPCGLFSSPLLTFQNVTAGHAVNGDNVRCIRNMKSVVAGYRTSTFNTVSNPLIMPAAGTAFSGSLAVTMSCPTAGASIRYTTNGTEPVLTSTLYTGTVTITDSTTFRAKAFKSGMDASSTVIAGYSRIAANDFFRDATAISQTSSSLAGNNINCTKESGEPSHYYSAYASVWWKWTAPQSGVVTFTTYGSEFDTTMAAYTGSSLTALTQLANNDDSGGSLQSAISFPVTRGAAYYIAVDGYSGAEGSITLNWDLEYLEVFTSSIVGTSGAQALRMTFAVRSGESYVVKRRESLSAADPWQDFTPPLRFTAVADGPYQLDIAIPASGGSAFFKVVRE